MADVARRLRQTREWLVAVERAWLGWSFAPPPRVLAETAWRPDEPAAFCPRCGSSVGYGEPTTRGCGSCRSRSVSTDCVVRLGAYTGPLREWVRAIKYRGWAEMADALGHRLGAAVARCLRAESGLDPGRAVVVPMPMPWQRRLYRGVDHAALIAAAAASELGVPRMPLLVMSNGPPQVSLTAGRRPSRGARLRLSRRAARLVLDGLPVVLVDDVRTTGASLNAAARLVRRLGPGRVVAGVLAVTDDPARRRAGEIADS